MKIMVLPRDDKSKGKPFYSLLVGLGKTQGICSTKAHVFFEVWRSIPLLLVPYKVNEVIDK